mmetsp:Transcript_8448/g.24220  ORF Transcript_8448/g.24220 Transcript_8448/m.24220 type:complete len:450 (+) Transcript_8448:242-1591(+)|eukprot:CAMPEP_0117668090 /NCGR_PEP_ID=MMETSP0804-20121206/11338_1 /TAXON_ID=1074897 /ORGANISM="Tetraselmis astigmatica, Strain CCMP880" /LENGTH=449 /DNA_ID=CAMNT_0005475907 /DNA_START=164 /DNA_END=1513 /DNA_ORIENTATION=-
MNAPWVKVLKGFPDAERYTALAELTEHLFKRPVIDENEKALFAKLLCHKDAGPMFLAKKCVPQEEVRRGATKLSAAFQKKLSKHLSVHLLKATKKEIAEALEKVALEDQGGRGLAQTSAFALTAATVKPVPAADSALQRKLSGALQASSTSSGGCKRPADVSKEAPAISSKKPKIDASVEQVDGNGKADAQYVDSDSEFLEDCLGPWPLPMDKGNRWLQFGVHFKKEIMSLASKSGVERKTVSSVLFACLKMLDGRQKVKTWEAENKGPLAAEMPRQLQEFNDLWQKAVGDGDSKGSSVLNDVMTYDKPRTLPLLQALQKRADRYQEEVKQMKESQSTTGGAAGRDNSRVKATMEAALAEKIDWGDIIKKDHQELKREVDKLDKDIEANKKTLESLAWDDLKGRATIVAKVKQQLKQRHEKKILVEEVNAEIKEIDQAIKDLVEWLSKL